MSNVNIILDYLNRIKVPMYLGTYKLQIVSINGIDKTIIIYEFVIYLLSIPITVYRHSLQWKYNF